MRAAKLHPVFAYGKGGATDWSTVEAARPSTLIDLRKAGNTDVPGLSIELRDVAKPGALVFLMEFQDPQTDKVLGRAADSTAAPVFAYGKGGATDWSTVEAAAEHWSILFRDFLDNNLAK